jgi:hypothetical protein
VVSKANKSIKRRRRTTEKPNKRANADVATVPGDSEDDVVFDTASDSTDCDGDTDATDTTETGPVLTNLIKVEVSKVLNVTWLTLDHSPHPNPGVRHLPQLLSHFINPNREFFRLLKILFLTA